MTEEEIRVSYLGSMAHFSGLSIRKLMSLPYDRLLAIFKDWQADTPKDTYLEPRERDEEKEEKVGNG